MFPFDDDYDEDLESSIADIKQCTLEGDADHVHAVGVEHRQGAQGHFAAFEFIFAFEGILGCIRHHECDVGFARADQLEVVD